MRSGASRRGEDRISNGTKRRCDAPCVISCTAFPPSGILMPDFRRPSPTVMLVCASMILTLALGIRHSFGLFLQPMSMDNGWGREVFGFAVALQNLLWGMSQPFTGMLADRFGARRVLFAGGLIYALGLVFMANSSSALGLTLAIGIFVGIGMSCTTCNIVFGALGRAYSAEKRSVVLGIARATVRSPPARACRSRKRSRRLFATEASGCSAWGTSPADSRSSSSARTFPHS